MQLLLGRCPKCNHDVKRVRGQFFCVRCQAFLLDPGNAAPVNYRDEEFPNSVFWTAARVYAFLRLNNQFGRKRRPHV
jgi:hypothetical protein